MPMLLKGFSMDSFVIGVMFGMLLAGAWFWNGAALFAPQPAAPAHADKVVPESGAVSVANQPAGDQVTVESVTVPPPSIWVAVRETNGEDLGNVLGALHITGPQSQIVVPLLRATEPGLTYAVELYRDDGDGAFDPVADSVYVDFETGAPVIARFSTTN
jgi:hypothetical protein